MTGELNTEGLSSLTLSRLYELARERSITSPRKYKKAQLVEKILAESTPSPVVSESKPDPNPDMSQAGAAAENAPSAGS